MTKPHERRHHRSVRRFLMLFYSSVSLALCLLTTPAWNTLLLLLSYAMSSEISNFYSIFRNFEISSKHLLGRRVLISCGELGVKGQAIVCCLLTIRGVNDLQSQCTLSRGGCW